MHYPSNDKPQRTIVSSWNQLSNDYRIYKVIYLKNYVENIWIEMNQGEGVLISL